MMRRDDSEFHVSYAPIQAPDADKRGFVICRLSDVPLVQEIPLKGVIL